MAVKNKKQKYPCNGSANPALELPFPYGFWIWNHIMEEEMATHSSVLFWEIPWPEEPDGLLSMGFSSHESWSRLMFRPLGDLPDPGIGILSLHLLLCRQILTAEPSGTLIFYW